MGALPVVTFLEPGSAEGRSRKVGWTWGRTGFSVSSSPFSSAFCLRFLLPIRSNRLAARGGIVDGTSFRSRGTNAQLLPLFRVFPSPSFSPFHSIRHVPLHSQAGVSLCSPFSVFVPANPHLSLPLPPVSLSRQPGLRLHHQNSRPLRRGWPPSFRKKSKMYVPTPPAPSLRQHSFRSRQPGQNMAKNPSDLLSSITYTGEYPVSFISFPRLLQGPVACAVSQLSFGMALFLMQVCYYFSSSLHLLTSLQRRGFASVARQFPNASNSFLRLPAGVNHCLRVSSGSC